MALQKNKIAMVSPSLNAYSETFIQAQKNGLEAEVFYYYGGNLPTHLENEGELLSARKRLFYKIKKKLRFTNFNPNDLAFIESLKKNKIELVFAQFGPVGHRLVRICKYMDLPLITHFHGYDASIYSVINNCNNYFEVFSYSKYIIAVSNSMKKKLIELGCPEEKLVYNTYGPDIAFSDLNPKFTDETFIGLGRFVAKKAPYYLILAFSKVLEKYPNAKLVIGGNGELLEVCENLVHYLRIEDNVLLPGVLSKEDFISHLTNALAFVQHSVIASNGDQEGTPVAILEASSAGLPIIGTVHAGIPDVILNDETGLLVEEHDVNTMTKKMLLLLENKELAIKLGENGKKRINSHFSLERHLDVLNKLINDAVLSQ
ncbi:glycosyltransferase [Flavobacterium anhuiense]|uniref:glycosyltransferase n=1 Tax=Flavobacterium anhuiense TaxID=459526 RepID=UPI000E6C9179|nr:glycosyltransferase [Flavobacterium anhuiense]